MLNFTLLSEGASSGGISAISMYSCPGGRSPTYRRTRKSFSEINSIQGTFLLNPTWNLSEVFVSITYRLPESFRCDSLGPYKSHISFSDGGGIVTFPEIPESN